MLSGSLIVLRQLFWLLLPAAGAGGGLWWLAGRPAPGRRLTGLWLGLAGLVAYALLLQSLVYIGIPLRYSTWPVMLLTLPGLYPSWRQARAEPKALGREGTFYAGIFLTGFLGQAVGLLALGPDRYYGNGHYDQANYVVTADFLVDAPFGTKAEDLGYRPWMLRALEQKEQRITECVLLGAVAVASGTDSQTTYGTVSIFLVALTGVATAAWLRSGGLPRWAAACAGLAATLSPALTRIHLDGFFSQAATLFVYPALAGVLATRGGLRRERIVIAALLLAYLIGTYTEVAIFGVTLTIALVLASGQSWPRRCRALALILAGALLLNPGYLGRLAVYLVDQWQRVRNPAMLAALFPDGGTWLGWGRLFVDGPLGALNVAAGLIVVALGLWGMVARRSHRLSMVIVLGVVALPLLFLRASPDYSVYAFAKLTVQFLPVWLGAAMIGLVCLRRPARHRALGQWAGAVVVTVIIFLTALSQQWRLLYPEGSLAVLSSGDMLQLRRSTEKNAGRTYLVAVDDPLLAQWYCYFARHSQVVFDRRNLGDRVVPTEAQSFRRWSGPADQLWWLDLGRAGPVVGYEPPPAVMVRGAQESGRVEAGGYYVAGNSLDFVLTRPRHQSGSRVVWLDFVITPVGPCIVELLDDAGRMQRTVVQAPGWRRWELNLPPGESVRHMRFRTVSGAPLPSNRTALLQSLSVEVAPGIPGVDPVPVPFVTAGMARPPG